MQSQAVSVTIATDDARIHDAMTPHGAEVVMTDAKHPSELTASQKSLV